MNLNIFTGGKGGIGKTLAALAVSLYHMKQNHKVLIIEFNIFNADISDILSKLKTKRDTINYNDDFRFIEIEGGSWLVTLDHNTTRHFTLPQNGIVGFYQDLNKIITFVKERQEEFPDDAFPEGLEHVIVDTGFHIANLIIDSWDKKPHPWQALNKDGNYPHNYLSSEEGTNLYVWFVWTMAAIEREGERQVINQVVRDELSKYQIGNFDYHHIRHIMTAFPEKWRWIPKWIYTRFDRPFNRLLHTDKKTKEITLSTITEAFKKINQLSTDDAKSEDRWDKVAEEILSDIDKSDVRRPKNVFPFPGAGRGDENG